MTYSRFRHLAIERAQPAPTEDPLAAIESLLGADLPASFGEFLSVANGAYIDYVVDVPLPGGKTEELSFCGIFSAEHGEFCDETFLGEIRSEREYKENPPQVLPFARDGGASMAYLDMTPEGGGCVVAYVHGLPEWTGLRTESAFVKLAPSFDGYVDLLRIDLESVLESLRRDAKELSHVEATEEYFDIGVQDWRHNPTLLKAVHEAKSRITSR